MGNSYNTRQRLATTVNKLIWIISGRVLCRQITADPYLRQWANLHGEQRRKPPVWFNYDERRIISRTRWLIVNWLLNRCSLHTLSNKKGPLGPHQGLVLPGTDKLMATVPQYELFYDTR